MGNMKTRNHQLACWNRATIAVANMPADDFFEPHYINLREDCQKKSTLWAAGTGLAFFAVDESKSI